MEDATMHGAHVPRRRFARPAPAESEGHRLVYERVLPAVPATVPRVRRELEGALARLHVAPERTRDIALVVSEAATNVVLHAYLDRSPGPLVVGAAVADRDLVLDVSDTGRGPAPRKDSPGLGCGLNIMRHCSDGLDVAGSEDGHGTHVTALFRHATPARAAPKALAASGGARLLADYVDAVIATSVRLQDDTRALVAEARQALARAHAHRERRRAAATGPR